MITVGRYLLHRQIARGGMATIHIARLMGDEGFSRIVAGKRLLPELAEDTEFVAMFMDEARIASKVHHPNVVPVLDLVTTSDEVMLVQEYVHGVPLHVLLRTAHEKNQKVPVRIAVSIAAQVLAGLHAAHSTLDELGAPLAIVHRDVSPQNVMIAIDGSARLLDFGIAKATMAAHVSQKGSFKGKLAYSAPEQVGGKPVQQSDIYALSVVLWELLVGQRMHGNAQGEAELVATIIAGVAPTITEALSNEADWGAIDSDDWKQLVELEPIVAKGLALEVEQRYQTAQEMERELTQAITPASASEVAAWLKSLGKDFIEGRDKIIAEEEASWRRTQATATATAPRRALTPVPGTVVKPQALESTTGSSPRKQRGGGAMIGILGALLVLLGVGVVFAMKSPDSEPTPAARVEAPPVVTPEVAPAPEPAPAEPPPVETVAEPAPEPPVAEPIVERAVTPKPPPPVRRPIVAKKKTTAAVPTPTAPPPAPIAQPIPEAKPAVVEKSADDCKVPYYFQGQKKVFKPNCL